MIVSVSLWIIATYLIASIPFSLLIGRFVLGVDIRDYGDGNPGATNVKRAGGSTFLLVVAVLMDGFKGLFPVGIAYWTVGWRGIEIVPIAIAALLGHAFSLYLGFNGGKAVAITGGVWIGLMIFEAALVLPVLIVYCFYSVEESDWAVALWMLCFLVYLLLTHANNTPFLLVWLGNTLILFYKHRHGLRQPPTLNCWIPLLCRKTS